MDVRPLYISRSCRKVLDRAGRLFESGRKISAQQLLAEHRPSWTPDERMQSFLLEEECFIRLMLWEEALKASKVALIATRDIDASPKAPLRLMTARSFLVVTTILLFQKSEQDHVTRFLESLARSPFFGLDFLRLIADIMRRIGYREQEVTIWELYLKHHLSKKERWIALVEKSMALLMSRHYHEAKHSLYTAARLFPREYSPYGLLAAIATMDGNLEKARYFCKSSWICGNRTNPYLRVRFVLLLCEERFDLASETFQLLIKNPRETVQTLFNHIFLTMHPRILALCEIALPKFQDHLVQTRLLSHKMQVCMNIMDYECVKAREIYDQNHTFTLPLIKMFWDVDIKPLYNLCHEEFLYRLETHSEHEINTFRTQYENIIDQPSFERYVDVLRKQRRVVGITLLAASRVIDTLADVLEECRVKFRGVIRFDPSQLMAFTFQHDHGIVFGKHIVHLGNMESIKTGFREEILKGGRQ